MSKTKQLTPEQEADRIAALRKIHDTIIDNTRNLHVQAGFDVVIRLRRRKNHSILTTDIKPEEQ